jgi:spermidine synthase
MIIMLYLLVFFSGFANLATEIIGPRLFASMFGNTTDVWAVMISVTLVGLSVGYSLGGRIRRDYARTMLPPILLINAGWLLVVAWLVWEIPASIITPGVSADASVLLMTASAAFFVPSVAFGVLSPVAITLLKPDNAENSETTGNIYAVGTIGSVAGALASAFFLIPYIGLSTSLQIFAIGLVLFAVYFWQDRRRYALGVAGVAIALILPQPDFVWQEDDGLDLLAQREGYYQTVRVYGNESFVQMHLGPTFHSRMDLDTREPSFSYAQTIIDLIDADLTGQTALVIGGAGHSITRELESRGASVTEVEIDPVVVDLSDEYFGAIEGDVVIADGRVYIEAAAPNTYDLIVVDAFDGAATVPPQLTTVEFFQAVEAVLKPTGQMLYNFVGTPAGDRDRAYTAISATLHQAFPAVGARSSRTGVNLTGTDSQNIIFVAAAAALDDDRLGTPPQDGTILTDDLNPMEIYMAESRDFTYFRR